MEKLMSLSALNCLNRLHSFITCLFLWQPRVLDAQRFKPLILRPPFKCHAKITNQGWPFLVISVTFPFILICIHYEFKLDFWFQGASFLLTDENGDVPYSFMAYLPLMGMTLFFFSLGFNWVVTLTLLGEIFSPSIKGTATSIATVVWWITDFITAKLYFISNDYLGISGTFFLFASCCIAGMIFVKLFVRETKNKTLAQIQALYKAKSEWRPCRDKQDWTLPNFNVIKCQDFIHLLPLLQLIAQRQSKSLDFHALYFE